MPVSQAVGFFGGEGLAGFGAALPPDAEVGPRENAKVPVARAVGEQRAGESQVPAGLDVLGRHRDDPPVAHLRLVRMHAQEQVQILLRANDAELPIVAVFVARAGVAVMPRVQFVDHIPELRVRGHLHLAAQVHANFRAVIAPQHGAVLDERDVQAQPRRGDGGARAGHAAADDDEVERARILRRLGKLQQLPAQRRQRGQVLRRTIVRIPREEDRVASPVKSRQVAQCDGRLRLANLDRPAVLPMPLLPLRPEDRLERAAVDDQAELARPAGALPGRRPIPRADPDAVRPRRGKRHRRLGVLDGPAHPVRQQHR